MKGLSVIRTVMADRNLRIVTLAFLGFAITEHATWVAIMVFAYQQGGVPEAGLAAVVQLIPSAFFAPVVGALGDRLQRERVLVASFGVLAIGCVAVALAMNGSAPALAVYLTAAVVAMMLTVGRPLVSAMLPSIADTPDELTAANVSVSLSETIGLFVGPAIAAVMLASGAPADVFLSMGFVIAVAAILMSQVHPLPGHLSDLDDEVEPSLGDILGGFRLLRDRADPRLIVLLMSIAVVADGVLDVAFAGIAVEVLGEPEARAGLLAAAVGLGSFAGAAGSLGLVGRRRLSTPFTIGLVTIGATLAVVALRSSTPLVVIALVVSGAGTALADLAGRTLLQGLSPEDTLARIFGVLEGISMLALAVGGALLSALTYQFGLRGALIALGSGIVVLALLAWLRIRAIDADRPEVDPGVLALVRANPLFAPLPAFSVEQLLLRLERHEYGPGAVVIRQGDDGDHFHLLGDGSAEVYIDGDLVTTLGRGDSVGEVALLHRATRNATVRAGDGGLVTHTLVAADFLEAVTGYPRSFARAMTQADRRSN